MYLHAICYAIHAICYAAVSSYYFSSNRFQNLSVQLVQRNKYVESDWLLLEAYSILLQIPYPNLNTINTDTATYCAI